MWSTHRTLKKYRNGSGDSWGCKWRAAHPNGENRLLPLRKKESYNTRSPQSRTARALALSTLTAAEHTRTYLVSERYCVLFSTGQDRKDLLVEGLKKLSMFVVAYGLTAVGRQQVASLLRKWAKTTASVVACIDMMELIPRHALDWDFDAST